MADKPFMRVKDKRTKHEYDIHRDRFDDTKHDRVKDDKGANAARAAKPYVPASSGTAAKTKAAAASPKSTVEKTPTSNTETEETA